MGIKYKFVPQVQYTLHTGTQLTGLKHRQCIVRATTRGLLSSEWKSSRGVSSLQWLIHTIAAIWRREIPDVALSAVQRRQISDGAWIRTLQRLNPASVVYHEELIAQDRCMTRGAGLGRCSSGNDDARLASDSLTYLLQSLSLCTSYIWSISNHSRKFLRQLVSA